MSETQANSGGVGFASLLTILFIGLKLGGIIHWSWWWVVSPMIFMVVFTLVVLVVVLGAAIFKD